MSKLKQLSGVANNLLYNLINPYNGEYLYELAGLFKRTGNEKVEIDLLDESADKEGFKTRNFEKVIKNSKNWFLSEIKRLEIDVEKIEKVVIKITKKDEMPFIISVDIFANGKKYSKGIISNFSSI